MSDDDRNDVDGADDVDDETPDDELDDDDDVDVAPVEGDEVVYDLAGWTLAQRAELQSHLVAFEVAHAWVGSDLSVKLTDESLVDELVTVVDEGLPVDSEPPGTEGEEIVYELDDWDDAVRRAQLAIRLEAAGVPATFEDDGALVVPVEWEAAVEELLDEIEFPHALAAEADPNAVGPDDADGAVVDGDDDDGDDDLPSASQEVLSDLFLASDRLLHDTGDVEGLEELRGALDGMEGTGPPYGLAGPLWRELGVLAGRLADQLTEGDDDSAVETATALRGLLRPYV